MGERVYRVHPGVQSLAILAARTAHEASKDGCANFMRTIFKSVNCNIHTERVVDGVFTQIESMLSRVNRVIGIDMEGV